MSDLGTLGSPKGPNYRNAAAGVNNSGAVTGISYDAHGNFFGFVWSNGRMTKMGTLGGFWSLGSAINKKGQITGQAYTKNGSAHAFRANCATCRLKDLGTIGGSFSSVWGFGINDSGVVVGQSTYQNNLSRRRLKRRETEGSELDDFGGIGLGADRSRRYQRFRTDCRHGHDQRANSRVFAHAAVGIVAWVSGLGS
jgi:probable HAF family extracellular repeat protein